MKKPISPESFIIAWNAASSVAEVAKSTGMKIRTCERRAGDYRVKGIPLKRFNSARGNAFSSEQLAELKELATTVTIAHPVEGFLDYLRFVEVWQTSPSFNQVCDKMGYDKPASATQVALRLRKLGVPLKKFRRGNHSINNHLLRELTRSARFHGSNVADTIKVLEGQVRDLEEQLASRATSPQ